jgi:hypothetical protein
LQQARSARKIVQAIRRDGIGSGGGVDHDRPFLLLVMLL